MSSEESPNAVHHLSTTGDVPEAENAVGRAIGGAAIGCFGPHDAQHNRIETSADPSTSVRERRPQRDSSELPTLVGHAASGDIISLCSPEMLGPL